MRFHVPTLPHTEVTRTFDWCAYTAKVRRFCDMMHSLGHEVYLYAGEENEAHCTEHVVVRTTAQREEWFADCEFSATADAWNPGRPWWEETNVITAGEVMRRAEVGDFLCCVGTSHEPIGKAVRKVTQVEYGIGYYGTFAPYRAYESYSHLHHVAGTKDEMQARFVDAVIPNSFHEEELLAPLGERKDYLLYMGRVVQEKGVRVAVETAQATGRRLIIAGAGDRSLAPDALWLGIVTGERKALLIANACAVLVPSLYIEPFGGIAVESMMSGTPAIATDWGAFTETVPRHYRCRTLLDFVTAVDRAAEDDGKELARRTTERFSCEVVRNEYERWFRRIASVESGNGYYEGFPELRKVS